MREQTRALKAILKKEFPETKFALKYIAVHNYASSSDRVVITYTGELSFKEVQAALRKYIRGMTVYEHGGVGCCWDGGFARNEIYNPNFKMWIDADMLEFIAIYRKECLEE